MAKDKKKDDGGEDVELIEIEKEEVAEPTVGEMRRGDYMIHVYIEQGKEFCGGGDTVDPMMEITCLGQKMYSTAKKDIGKLGEVNWSEHIFLEPKNVEKLDAEKA